MTSHTQHEDPDSDLNTVELNTPIGKLKATSRDMITLLITVCLFVTAFCAYLIWDHAEATKRSESLVVVRIEEGFKAIQKTQDQATSVQKELIYLMTLTPEKREKLRLDMPESLRNRARIDDATR